MGCINFIHQDRDFIEAICSYQDGDSKLLEDWASEREEVTDTQQIIEIIHQIFMISDSYFRFGTAGDLAKVLRKCKPTENIKDIGYRSIDPHAWLENPYDFIKLFNAFEETFCNQEAKKLNNKFKNAAEYFSCQRLDNPQGFWKAVGEFHSTLVSLENGDHNLPANVDTWLSQVPKAKEFVEPYCHYINSQVNFSHIAYAYLNHGYEIEKNILGLFPSGNPKPYNVFKKAADYCELKAQSDNLNTNNAVKKIKL